MDAIYFESPAAFRRWLEKHHRTAEEVLVGYHKRHTKRPSLTWQESVDEALCIGWIDGIRRSVDADRYTIRFTPRRKGSIWSAVNVRRVAALTEEGRMRPSGLAAFEARTAEKTALYSYERQRAALTKAQLATFKKNTAAWKFFEAQPPGYRKIAAFYVSSAKKVETQARRLQRLIDDSAAGRKIGVLERPGKK